MAVMTTSTFAKNNWPGIKSWFGLEYKDHQDEHTMVFEKETSDKLYEEYVGQVGFGLAPVKAETEGISYDSMSQGFVVRGTNVVYGLGFKVSEEAIEDGRAFNIAKKGAKSIARSLRHTRETNGANILNRAFNGSYAGGDALELCSDVHLNAGDAGGTFQNELTTAADLSEFALEQAIIDINSWSDDRGLKIAIRPKRLIIPPAVEFEAERFLASALRPDSANNDINAVRSTGYLSGGYAVNHYLTDTDAWFITTDCADGLIYQERKKDSFDRDREFETDNVCYKGKSRYVFLWADPKGIYGSPGA